MGLLSLIIKMGLDATGVDVGLRRAESAVSKFGKKVGGSLKAQIGGALSVTALVAASKAAVDYASKINDVSTQLGIGTDTVQEFNYAMKQSGGTLEDMVSVMQRLAANRIEALSDPAGKMAEAFTQLGVSAEDLKRLKLEDIVLKIGDAFEKARNPQELLASGFATMGRGALPVIGAMREGLRGMGEDAKKTFGMMTEDAIAALDDIGDAFDIFKSDLLGGFGMMIAEVLDGFMGVYTLVKSFSAGVMGYWGAKSGGASDEEADRLAAEERADVVGAYDARLRARGEKIKKRREMAAGALRVPDLSPSAKDDGGVKVSGFNGFQKSSLNSLQQIGAFTGNDPVLRELQASHVTAKKTEANTRKALDKTKDQSLEGFA